MNFRLSVLLRRSITFAVPSHGLLVLLCLTPFATSCIPPASCIDRNFGPPREHLVTIHAFSGPVDKPGRGRAPTVAVGEHFEHAAVIGIEVAPDGSGRLAVSTIGGRPRSCSTISAEDLAEVSRSWQAVLDRFPAPQPRLRVMTNPYTGSEDWRPDGSLLSLSVGSPFEKSLGVMWDGESTLPEWLDPVVMATLDVMCSNNRLAREHVLRSFPQMAGRLECR